MSLDVPTRRFSLGALPQGFRVALFLGLLLTFLSVNQLALLTSREYRTNNAMVRTAELLYVPNANVTRVIFLGYNMAAADVVWLRTLFYFGDHLNTDRKYEWLLHFINQIINLDPEFRKIYHWAGTNVLYGQRFTNQNVMLSSRFYQMALDRFPDDVEAAFRLGMNWYVEMRGKNAEEKRRFRARGIDYLERAANMPGAPPFLRQLVAAAHGRLGDTEVELSYLRELYFSTEDPIEKERLRDRIRAVRGSIDTEALKAYGELKRRWEENLPYTQPGLYTLLGEPTGPLGADVDWRTLTPLSIDGDAENDPP